MLHGDRDPTVSVEYARQMRAILAKFHPDFSYYEYPGGNHWWSNESVDWPPLLSGCPIHVKRGSILFGKEVMEGDNYGAYIMFPRPDSKIASVAAVTGIGLPGMHAADANQYFAGGSGFPDYMIFTADIARDGVKAMKWSGFFGNGWELEQ